jgi:hypothetical protein
MTIISTKANAVSGPTQGCVFKRRAAGHFSTSSSIACVSLAIVGFSRSSNSSRSRRRWLAQGANLNASNCSRPASRHNFFGKANRFQCGKQIACYLGLVPLEKSSGESATAGAYHETRELSAAFPAGRSGASDGAQPPGLAEQVLPPDDAARTEDRQGRHGAKTGGPIVLDATQGGPWLVEQKQNQKQKQRLQLERNGALFRVHGAVRSKST